MVYQPNIPQPTDQLSVSQGDILGNFQALEPIAEGVFIAPLQALAPVVPAGSNALYTLVPTANPLTGNNELFLRNDPAGSNIPITARGAASSGWTYLPSGILLKWGAGVASTMGPGASAPINFPANPQTPVFTAVYNVQITMETGGGAVDANTFAQVINFGIANFTVWVGQRVSTSAAATSFPRFYYLAIGI